MKALAVISLLVTIFFGILAVLGVTVGSIHDEIATIHADIELSREQARLRETQERRDLERVRAQRLAAQRQLEEIRAHEASAARQMQAKEEAADRALKLREQQEEKKAELTKERTQVTGSLLHQGFEILREWVNRH